MIYLKVAEYILNVPTTKKKWQLCDVIEVVANAVVVIILQYISASNHHTVNLKLTKLTCQIYLNKAGEKKG